MTNPSAPDAKIPTQGTPVRVLYKNWRGEVAYRNVVLSHIWFGTSPYHEGAQWFASVLDADKDMAARDFALTDCMFNPPEWVFPDDPKTAHPEAEGRYTVLLAGDSETCDGHTLYDYPDYQDVGVWHRAPPEDFEDFEGGFKGNWQVPYGEGEDVIGWCGPLPDYPLPPRKKGAR